MQILFDEVDHFEEFMVTIANNNVRDIPFGMVMRVSLGAFLSMTDGATDIYVISNYYKNTELVAQANALVIMVSLSMLSQLCVVMGTYAKKSWVVKLRESLITISFLRPAVDAYRISTNH